jgi:hypothetical protein
VRKLEGNPSAKTRAKYQGRKPLKKSNISREHSKRKHQENPAYRVEQMVF